MDIRIDVDFFENPKVLKLERRLGMAGIRGLLSLWMWAAKNRPGGTLYGMDEEDIEIVSKYNGEPGGPDFVETLLDLRFVERDDSGDYILHQWTIHNPWVADSPFRSDQARLARLARAYPELYDELVSRGVQGLSKEEYRQAVAEYRSRCASTNALRPVNDSLRPVNDRSTPPPPPQPNPSIEGVFDPGDNPQDNRTLSTKLPTNPQMAKGEKVEVFLHLYRQFPGYRPASEGQEFAWASNLSEYFDNLNLEDEFRQAIRWVRKKRFLVRDSKAFLTDWLKRVQKERREHNVLSDKIGCSFRKGG